MLFDILWWSSIRKSMGSISSNRKKIMRFAALKEKYQGGKKSGASTLISRARSQVHVPEKTPRPASKGGPIDPLTGKKVFEPTGRAKA